jgi:glycine/sarcosine N-methyltransferase
MSFYQSFVSYYDRIFPLNQPALSFLSNYFQPGESILDIGAGTGNMAIALAEKEIKVTASEPDETMAESIRSKMNMKGLTLSVQTKSMEQIEKFQNNFDGIICIGNTLPHLPDEEGIERFLSQCHQKLNKDGRLILQMVNYDKVLSTDDFSFPVIQKDDFSFTRRYEKVNDHIYFTSILTVHEESTENTIPLYPITSQRLIALLTKAGFESVQVYGNFKAEDFNRDSPALIVVAK